MKIGIYGYGNLGKGVELAIRQNPDMELFGLFTRRDPKTVKTLTGAPAYAAEEAAELAIEEALPTGPQPVGMHTWIMLAACALALALGILIAAKYRQ